MKKTIFFGIGAAALAIGGVFATKANSKFAAVSALYYKNALGTCVTTPIASLSGNTQIVTGTYAGVTPITFNTTGGNTAKVIYASNTCSKQVYFHP